MTKRTGSTHLVVAGGILIQDDLVLIAQRKRGDEYGLKWEFPGGKLKPGETGEECIIRELEEELCINVRVTGFFAKFTEDDLTILYYKVQVVSGEIQLNEHEQVKWVTPCKLNEYDLLSCDRDVATMLAKEQ